MACFKRLNRYTMLYDYEKDNAVLAMALAKVKQVFIS